MAVAGWVVDKSAAVRAAQPKIADQLDALVDPLYICPVGRLEQLYSARSATHYDVLRQALDDGFERIDPPPDAFDQALALQRDLAHHHGMWHRTPIPDLLIATTALHHNLGVVHLDSDYDRITAVRPLVTYRLQV